MCLKRRQSLGCPFPVALFYPLLLQRLYGAMQSHRLGIALPDGVVRRQPSREPHFEYSEAAVCRIFSGHCHQVIQGRIFVNVSIPSTLLDAHLRRTTITHCGILRRLLGWRSGHGEVYSEEWRWVKEPSRLARSQSVPNLF